MSDNESARDAEPGRDAAGPPPDESLPDAEPEFKEPTLGAAEISGDVAEAVELDAVEAEAARVAREAESSAEMPGVVAAQQEPTPAEPAAAPSAPGTHVSKDGIGWHRPETPWQQSASAWQPRPTTWQSPGEKASAPRADQQPPEGVPPAEGRPAADRPAAGAPSPVTQQQPAGNRTAIIAISVVVGAVVVLGLLVWLLITVVGGLLSGGGAAAGDAPAKTSAAYVFQDDAPR
ncbi:hypothetical protein [Specibacter cremeus]|uniref:hypothetical protein n=1 Tax=Specibacter cremeus TaxID=1629051 RepID=UPI000F78D034|nr:hypothetical protein [Specibacter cremeus]